VVRRGEDQNTFSKFKKTQNQFALSSYLGNIIKTIRSISKSVTNDQQSTLIGLVFGRHGDGTFAISFGNKIHISIVIIVGVRRKTGGGGGGTNSPG